MNRQLLSFAGIAAALLLFAGCSKSPTAPGQGGPSAPNSVSPTNGAQVQAVGIILSWNSSSGAESYGVQISTTSTFATTILSQTGVTATQYDLTGLSGGTTYYWRENAENSAGTSAWSGEYSFTTAAVTGGWIDGFESYIPDSFPYLPWINSGNTAVGIDTAFSYSGQKSLKLYGVIGGCWAAVLSRTYSLQPPIEISFDVYNGSEALSGCHPGYGGAGLTTQPTWNSSWRYLISFNIESGRHIIRGTTNASSGDTSAYFALDTFQTLQWYTVKITYTQINADSMQLSYWINQVFKGSYTVAAVSYESQLSYLTICSGEGSAWFDNVQIQ